MFYVETGPKLTIECDNFYSSLSYQIIFILINIMFYKVIFILQLIVIRIDRHLIDRSLSQAKDLAVKA